MKKIIICSVLATLLSSGVLAAEVETHVNFDTREVAVSGTVSQAEFNRMVSVAVSDDTVQYYVNTVGTEADGSYRLTFRMPEEAKTGYYSIAVGALGKSEPVKQDFYYAKKADIDNILNAINNSSSASDVSKKIEENIEVLNIPFDWYRILDNSGKTAVAEALYRAKPYSAIGAATDVAFGELAIQVFRCVDSADRIAAALQTFAEVYNINADTAACYDLYNSFDFQAEANAIMAGYSCKSTAEIIKAYNESTLLAAVNHAADPAEIAELIEKYKSVIPFSLNSYNNSDKEKIVSYLYKCNAFRSMNELEKAINNAGSGQSSGKPSGGGSGGGGGSSSSVVNLAPPVKNEINNDTEQNDDKNNTFDDLGSVAWAKEAIEYLADKKIITGIGGNRFDPDSFVTREQFVLMIMKAFDMIDTSAVCDFDDVPATHWAYEAVASACQNEIIFGVDAREFGAGQAITRQDMAVIVYRAAKKAGYQFENSGDLSFSDTTEIADYARESVSAMSAAGIIKGHPDFRFAPLENTTRAQAAQVIYAVVK